MNTKYNYSEFCRARIHFVRMCACVRACFSFTLLLLLLLLLLSFFSVRIDLIRLLDSRPSMAGCHHVSLGRKRIKFILHGKGHAYIRSLLLLLLPLRNIACVKTAHTNTHRYIHKSTPFLDSRSHTHILHSTLNLFQMQDNQRFTKKNR